MLVRLVCVQDCTSWSRCRLQPLYMRHRWAGNTSVSSVLVSQHPVMWASPHSLMCLRYLRYRPSTALYYVEGRREEINAWQNAASLLFWFIFYYSNLIIQFGKIMCFCRHKIRCHWPERLGEMMYVLTSKNARSLQPGTCLPSAPHKPPVFHADVTCGILEKKT